MYCREVFLIDPMQIIKRYLENISNRNLIYSKMIVCQVITTFYTLNLKWKYTQIKKFNQL